MKLNLNTEIGHLNRLKGKELFTVSDLIKILSDLDEDAEIVFGVLTENYIKFVQDDNFIFKLEYNSLEDEGEGIYTVQIITDGKRFS